MFANRVFEIGMKCRYMNTGFMKYRSRIRNKKIRKYCTDYRYYYRR
ncbi:hypothetical protein HanRHA438_Chr05g0214941 [Helianthus annuus]|nr:hypothetical protein HanRHA438_Chr05g0214941 [Helianthus annuus]